MGSPYDTIETMNRRRTMVRSVLFMIILGTLPFYLIGFWLWGTAPDADAQDTNTDEAPLVTSTPLGQGEVTEAPTLRPTRTPFPTLPPLQFTPPQFQPPAVQPTNPPVIIPTSTTAPTLTPLPTNTPFPTNTPLPAPTDTPFLPPTDTPAPSNGGDSGGGAPPPPDAGPPGNGGGNDSGGDSGGDGPPGDGGGPPPGG